MAWLAYGAVLFLFHVPFFVRGEQWLLLTITTTALFSAAWTLMRTQCTRCGNLSCPLNRVPEDVRRGFYACYPAFREAKRQK